MDRNGGIADSQANTAQDCLEYRDRRVLQAEEEMQFVENPGSEA